MTKSTITLYHNPRCSKSRQALQLLQDNGIQPHIIEYLKQPLDKNRLEALVNLLQLAPEEIVRQQDSLFKELNIDAQTMDHDSWLHLLLEHPALLQRPIVANEQHAIVARPPEQILGFLSDSNND